MDEDANDFSSALPHASMNLANIEKSFVSKPCKKSFLIAIFPAQKKVLKNFQSIWAVSRVCTTPLWRSFFKNLLED